MLIVCTYGIMVMPKEVKHPDRSTIVDFHCCPHQGLELSYVLRRQYTIGGMD